MRVLDERHFSADQLLSALDVLRRVVGNILDAPADERYRRVKLSSAAWQGKVAPLGADAERLLHVVGFRRHTVDNEASLVFDAPAESAAEALGATTSGGRGGGRASVLDCGGSPNGDGERDEQLLAMARQLLDSAAERMAEKVARDARERLERAAKGAAAERNRLRLARAAAEDRLLRAADHAARRRAAAAAAVIEPAPAVSTPSSARQQPARQQVEEDEDGDFSG